MTAVFGLDIYQRAIELLPVPIAVVDTRGMALFLNDEFVRSTGLGAEQLEHDSIEVFFSPAVEVPKISQLKNAWRGSLAWQIPGKAILETNSGISPLITRSGEHVGFIITILTIHSSSAQSLEASTAQKSRLEALGVLAGSVAHDLNNLLTGVLGHVSFLRVSLGDKGNKDDSVRAIEDGARKAAFMTQQILDHCRGQEGVFSQTDLSDVVHKTLELVSPTLPSNIELKVRAANADFLMEADEGQLHQLVMNLVFNARDALVEGGEIGVLLRREELQQDTLVGDVHLSPGLDACLEVSDTGTGISSDIVEKIFEPFFSTKGAGGTGLGLASVLSVVRSHLGGISIDSREGEGTTFSVFLPLAESAEQAADKTAGSESEIPVGSEKILVVDDEEAVRLIIQRCLEHLGYEVVVAKNGAEGLEAYRESMESYSLVIIDMIMPKMPGDELYFRLRELNPQAPVLVASGFASDARTKAILDAGGLGFIQKPFDVEELAREVRRCLDLGS